MTRDELLLRVTRLFLYKRPELLVGSGMEGSIVTKEEYDRSRGALANGPWRWPMHWARRALYERDLEAAAMRLQSGRKNPLPGVIGDLIDHILTPGAARLYGNFEPVALVPGDARGLSNQLLGVLGDSVAEFLIPGIRSGEWERGKMARGEGPLERVYPGANPLDAANRIEFFEGQDGQGDRAVDTGDSISVAATPEECGAIAAGGARAEERSVARSRVAELLAGYPKFVVDLAHAAGSRGTLEGWAQGVGVSYVQARRWAADLKRELRGGEDPSKKWFRLARKYGHGDLSPEPGKSHWEYGSRTDPVTCRVHTGWIHSGEVPSGSPWFEDPAVASAYWSDRRGK